MNETLFAEGLTNKISSIFNEKNSRFAVAFWGRGVVERFFHGSLETVKVICNLATGGTNPLVIEQLMQRGAQVKQHDQLHAKVYIGETFAVITSANASVNGLGLEGVEQEGWLEAGVVTEPGTPAIWFDQLWNDPERVREVTNLDIERAKKLFVDRAAFKPSRRFEAFDVNTENLPLLDCYIDLEFQDNLEEAMGQLGIDLEGEQGYNTILSERIDRGVEIYDKEIENFTRNTWCLKYKLNNDRRASLNMRPWWTCLAGSEMILENVRTYNDDGRTESVMIAVENFPPEPFVVTKSFHEAFCQLINNDRYNELRNLDWMSQENLPTQAFFTPERRELMKEFWRELHKKYVSPSAG